MHPFINDLSSKTLEELQNSISSITEKLNFAYRTQNTALIRQLNMALESYNDEYHKKMNEAIKKQNIQNKININKE